LTLFHKSKNIGRLAFLNLVILVNLAQFSHSYGDTPSGQAGAFLRLGLGARAIGMGNAMTGLAADGFAGFHNPGSLPFLTSPELAFSMGLLSLDRTHSYIGFSTYLQPKTAESGKSVGGFRGGLALGWIHAGVENIDIRDGDGNHFGMLSNSENAFFASFALQPVSFIGVGVTIKVVLNRFPGIANDASTVNAEGFYVIIRYFLF